MNLIEHLQAAGYDPQNDPTDGGDWFDLVVSGIGSIRVCVYPGDDDVMVYAFDGGMCVEWQARFSPGTPDAAVIGTIEAAEWALAERRGGPVTPAQAESAS